MTCAALTTFEQLWFAGIVGILLITAIVVWIRV